MAAALKVSAAPKTTDLFLSLKSLPSFPIVVVLPTPLTPEITMIVDLLFPKSDKFFSYFNKSTESCSAKIFKISLGS